MISITIYHKVSLVSFPGVILSFFPYIFNIELLDNLY